MSLLWVESAKEGLVFIVKSISYFFVFFVITGALIELLKYREAYLISKIAQLSILSFLLVGVYIFYTFGGISIFSDIVNAILSGNTDQISHKYLPIIFKFDFISSGEIEDWANSRNTLALAFANILATSLIFSKSRSLFFYSITSINIVLLILCLSRSGHIYLLIILGVLVLTKVKFKYLLFGSFIFIPILTYFLLFNDVVYALFLSRYEGSGGGARSSMNNLAIIELFNNNPFTGFGIGKKIIIYTGTTYKDFALHNLFIGSWYSSGIMGLLFSILFVFNLVYTSIINYILFFKEKILAKDIFSNNWPLIFIIPLFPILRMMVSGNYGNPGFLEWTSISIFAACVVTLQLIPKLRYQKE